MSIILAFALMYVGFFLFYTFLKTISKKLDKIIFCSVCATFFSVMVISFILKADLIISFFLLGMSITGLVYKIEEELIKRKKKIIGSHFIIQLILTLLIMGVILIIRR